MTIRELENLWRGIDFGSTTRPMDRTDEAHPSPLRSVLALAGGWIALYVLGVLFGAALGVFLPDDVNQQTPTHRFLIAFLLSTIPNGLASGVLTARIAGWGPLGHTAVLAGYIALMGMLTSDQAHGLPWWFALGRIVLPALAVWCGGLAFRVLRHSQTAARGSTAGRADGDASSLSDS